jgi:hypothetical protein
LDGEFATKENTMLSDHDKIDSKKVIDSLNTILELELAGVVRYAMAGEHVTSLGGHPSLNIGKLVESHKT